MTNCTQCSNYQAELTRLREEVKRLQRENAHLKNLLRQARQVIQTQRRQLNLIQQIAFKLMSTAEEKLQRGSLPRGQWSYTKGKFETAQIVFQFAAQDYASGILAAIAGFVR